MNRSQHRRILLAAACAALAAWPAISTAQTPATPAWPSKPITFVVSYPPGGGADLIGRLLAEKMAPALGQTIVVENRAGAAGQVGAASVARAVADGHTVLIDAASFAINPALQPKLQYNPAKDFTTVGVVALFPHLVLVTPSFKAGSVAELREEAKRSPLFVASSGSGSTQHIAAVMLQRAADFKMTHVPYKGGGPAMTDVMAGQVPVFMGNAASSLSHVKGGKLKALAVAGNKRLAALPALPTLGELGIKGAEMYEWNGLFVPAGTPPAVVERLAQALAAALALPEVKERIAGLSGEIFSGGPAEAAKFVANEMQRMAEVVRSNDIKPD